MSTKPNYNKLYQIAEYQVGYFSAKQAHSVGFSKERISYYINTGKFTRIHRGIYRLVQFAELLSVASYQGGRVLYINKSIIMSENV